MKAATHFIEVAKFDGIVTIHNVIPIRHFDWFLNVNEKFGIETIAIFKIYPKPLSVKYEYDIKTQLVE
jgi:hypothetical protein